VKTYLLRKNPTDVAPTDAGRQFQIDYRKELNPAQFAAATSVNGPHLIVAGAGTGKTRTITFRVAYLVELGVKPESILLLTFTRRAAQEMLRRASMLLDSRCERVAGGTFHSFANLVLRQYAPLLGFQSSFSILDQSDAEDVVNLLRTRMKLDSRERRFPRKQTLFDIFSRVVNTGVPLRDVLKEDYPHFEELLPGIEALMKAYVAYKAGHDLMDYDDLLVHLRTLLRDHERVRESLAERYKYVMVDEYQDTNRVQAEIVWLLGRKFGNVMVVGDDAQAIYAFRGATVQNILAFPEQYPGCTIIKLEENYRSTQPILDLTNEILRRARE
jgi:DNA helicase II / ATP-dependent DNA helicase PcrA